MNSAESRRWLLQPGEELNNTYQIDRALGHGGMGEVYVAHNVSLDEDIVAIKVILPEKAKDENFRELFGREARALLRIRHPTIVGYRSFSHDRELDLKYIVTDFVEGQNLADRLKQGPLSYDEMLTLARPLAEGLKAVHESRIVHRDLAPDNVILEDGDLARPKIIDFGVVKDTSGALLTIVGDNIVGKLKFMAPEQLGKPRYDIGPWTDIYSLGLVLLAVRRGEPADMGGSFADAIEKRQATPDLDDLDLPTRTLLSRLLPTHPSDRCQSMAEVLALLDPAPQAATVVDELPEEPKKPKPRKKPPPPEAERPKRKRPRPKPKPAAAPPPIEPAVQSRSGKGSKALMVFLVLFGSVGIAALIGIGVAAWNGAFDSPSSDRSYLADRRGDDLRDDSDEDIDPDSDDEPDTSEIAEPEDAMPEEEPPEDTSIQMRPGLWETRMVFTDINASGVPAEVRSATLQQMNASLTPTSQCLTEADIQNPNNLVGSQNPLGCRYDQFDQSGNRMTVRMTCQDNSSMSLRGEYGPETYSFSMAMRGSDPTFGQISMSGQVSGRRLGSC